MIYSLILSFTLSQQYLILFSMNDATFYTRVPHSNSHGHFGNTVIESFPDLHAGPSFLEKGLMIRETLKYQLLTTKPEQAARYVNLRECFKLHHRNHVEFCLKEKAPGVTLEEAAREMGYRKI